MRNMLCAATCALVGAVQGTMLSHIGGTPRQILVVLGCTALMAAVVGLAVAMND